MKTRNRIIWKTTRLTLGTFALYLSQGPAALAQTVAEDAAPSSLEEVVVTARRKEENLQTVPVAVTVLNQEELNQNSIQSLQDLQFYVPSLSETGQRRDAMAVSIRGQGSSGYSSLPGVLVYMNEVPTPVDNLGQTFTGPGTLFDLENVQVLKGPQGTLFGRNAIGGAILLESKRPTNDFGGSVEIGYGNYNDREAQATLNVPILDDRLAFRLAVSGQWRDGFTHLLSDPAHPNGVDLDDVNYNAVRGTVTFRPSADFQNDIIFDRLQSSTYGTSVILDNLNPTGVFATLYPAILSIFAQQQALGIRTQVPLDSDIFSTVTTQFLTDILRQDLTDTVTFRNILGFRRISYAYGIDFDGSAMPVLDFGSGTNFLIEQFTEEAQLQGKSLQGALDWVAGAFYENSPPQDFAGNDPQTELGTTSINQSRMGDSSKALYLQGTADLGSILTGLKTTAGFRYTWDTRYLQNRILDANGVCPGTDVMPDSTCTTTNSGSWRAPSWTYSLDYQIDPRTLVYVATRRGYRSGGFNAGITDPSLANFAPETVTDEELGTKVDFSLFGFPTRINADVYHQGYDNIQVNQFVFVDGNLDHITQNAATARLWGAEFEQWTNVGTHLQLGVNFDWVNLRYTSFAPGVDPAPLVGEETYDRPPYKYGANARYTFMANDVSGTVSAWANYTWQDKNGDTADVGGVIPSFGLLTLGAAWDHLGGQPLDVSLFMTNALNKTYVVQAQSLYSFGLGAALATYGEPRMYGVRFRYSFGRTN
jgi:iron complex outermembrane recepter protein